MVPTAIAGEHPLTLYVDKREIVTLMTLGHAPEALAIGYLRNQRLVRVASRTSPRCRSTGKPNRSRSPRDNGKGCELAAGQAHRHHRLRPGHGVRRPDGGDRRDQAARRRHAHRRETCSCCSTRCASHETIYKQAGAVHGCALADTARRDPDVRRGRRPPQRGRRDRRLHVARRHRRLRQGVLHHRAAHLRNGDQVRADAHPVPRLALRPHPDGPRDRARRSASRCSAARAAGTTCLHRQGAADPHHAAADRAGLRRTFRTKYEIQPRRSPEPPPFAGGREERARQRIPRRRAARAPGRRCGSRPRCGAGARSAAPPPTPRRARRRSAPRARARGTRRRRTCRRWRR